MNILEVIPFSRGLNKDTLTYFTSSDVSPGAIVKVPLRGRDTNALVVGVRKAEDLRQEVKSSTFAFKKTSAVVSLGMFSPAFMHAVEKTARFHAASVGSLLASLVPKIVLENADGLEIPKTPETAGEKSTVESAEKSDQSVADSTHERLHGQILQADDAERFSDYRSLIRQEFAKGRSVFLCVPSATDIKRAEKLLEKGIGEYSYIFYNQVKKKDFVERWNSLAHEKHPVLIIATGQFFCLPRYDLGTIIIERENSRTYKSISRPFVDLRIFAEMFARESSVGAAAAGGASNGKTPVRLVLADTLLRTETFWRYKHDELGEVTPPSLRLPNRAELHLIDMRKMGEPGVSKLSSKFDPISPWLAELVKTNREKSEHLFIFASRRGLSPLTVCSDCGAIVSCHRCQAPTVLHVKTDDRFFLCHRCGEKRSAHEKCEKCGSWRLQALGVGVELIAKDLQEKFPDAGQVAGQKIFRIDSDSVKTHAQASAIAKKFYEAPGSVLVGTEMALFYLDEKIENTAVASLDSMFSLPDFRIRQKIMAILVRLRSLAEKKFLIQTRNIAEPIFGLVESGNLIDFYKAEFEDRKTFDYPPFTVLIKISVTGERKSVAEAMEYLKKFLGEFEIGVYPAFAPFKKGLYTMHALIKIGRERWVDPGLYEKLRSLPPTFTVAVDPESIL